MNIDSIETPKIGDILKEEFLEPLGLTAYRLAKEINVSTSSILDLVHNKRKISLHTHRLLDRNLPTLYGAVQRINCRFYITMPIELRI
ncbi:MAG TPA: addiction module antidote protein, HigA family [Treponemataceae bacterium]|nr:addiction module antidote protein, HigA family [Treponemataceae bacterium]